MTLHPVTTAPRQFPTLLKEIINIIPGPNTRPKPNPKPPQSQLQPSTEPYTFNEIKPGAVVAGANVGSLKMP